MYKKKAPRKSNSNIRQVDADGFPTNPRVVSVDDILGRNQRLGIEVVGAHLGPRTRSQYPYSYDPILQFVKRDHPHPPTGSVYTDRLFGWYGYQPVRDLQQKVLGTTCDYWSSFEPEEIEAFLRECLGYPDLVLLRIEEHCNQIIGYPLWFFSFWRDQEKPKVGGLPSV